MILTDVLALALILLAGFLFAGALAPFEALGWWAGWFGRKREDVAKSHKANTVVSEAKHFVVFLSGINSVSEESFARGEIDLLKQLKTRLEDTVIIELFPYSVTNQALTGQRFFS